MCRRESLQVTSSELAALLALHEADIEGFAGRLDAKIVRASVSGGHHAGRQAAGPSERGSSRIGRVR